MLSYKEFNSLWLTLRFFFVTVVILDKKKTKQESIQLLDQVQAGISAKFEGAGAVEVALVEYAW